MTIQSQPSAVRLTLSMSISTKSWKMPPKKLQLKVSVKLNDDDWQKIQKLFDQERKWIIGKM